MASPVIKKEVVRDPFDDCPRNCAMRRVTCVSEAVLAVTSDDASLRRINPAIH
ncbi:hypothetical protein [Microbulbifer epialgicus]|uniref:Uncharacterized protein n=1 Tax=Microbulbifer epialgicus TaxID=393907 RepID=A0ABV4NX04_9GAMM